MRAKGAKNTIQHKSGAKKVSAHGSDSCKDTVMARLPVEHNWCATCRGTVRPRELRIVTLRQLKRAMAEGVTLCP